MFSYLGDRYINYDNVGNPTHYLTASNSFTDTNANMTWTRGSLLKSYITGGNTVLFDYNVQGRRYFKSSDGITKRYYLDGGKILGEDWSTGTKIRYIYNLTGLAGFYLDGEIGQFGDYLYAKDAQGNIVNIFKDNYLVASYDYDAWGNCTVYDANGNITTANNHIGNINPFRWKSYYFDKETGFYYINGRYYDPAMMQFINSDYSTLNSYKIGGLNPYSLESAFGVSNPLQVPPNRANISTSIPLVAEDSGGSSSSGGFGSKWWHWAVAGVIVVGATIITAGAAAGVAGLLGATTAGVQAVAVGATVGGLTAGGVNLASQAITNRRQSINVGSLITSTVIGGIAGGISGGISNLSTGITMSMGTRFLIHAGMQVGANILLSNAAYAIQCGITGSEMTLYGFGMATLGGLVSGLTFGVPFGLGITIGLGGESMSALEDLFGFWFGNQSNQNALMPTF